MSDSKHQPAAATLRCVCFALGLAALLTGCATLGNKPATPVVERSAPEAQQPVQQPAQQPPAAVTRRGGGYYLDDGPGDNPPPDIDAIPDAQPRMEPPLARANRPYVALGESYTPMAQYQPYRTEGIASWYGRRYHNQKTSSGELYDMYGMTAAHPTLPIPSFARITNPENGRSVVVRINDRGPFKKDRVIDLSYAAAYKLRLTEKGSGRVEVEAIDPRNPTPAVQAKGSEAQSALNMDAAPPASGSFVQAGAFKLKENADLLRDKLRQQNLTQNVTVENWYNDGVYRVRLGPYANRDAAVRAAGEIRQALGVSTLVITQ
ncbi:RlpA-like protein precursor [mine drainage metagenome]|uniref:RlpA-like protein n=1 Tax=mine drainage metagenome TaxID=410659 RepID=A0A1J5QMQ1_9ZZZZ